MVVLKHMLDALRIRDRKDLEICEAQANDIAILAKHPFEEWQRIAYQPQSAERATRPRRDSPATRYRAKFGLLGSVVERRRVQDWCLCGRHRTSSPRAR